MAGAKTIIETIGSIRWKTNPEFLPVLRAAFPPGADADAPPPGARILKDGPRRTVSVLETTVGPVLLKRFRPDAADRLRELVDFSVAERELRASRRLRAQGIEIPEPLAAGDVRRDGLPFGSLFFARFLAGARSVLDVLKAGEGDRALWEALGRMLARTHRADFFHPDLHLGNVLAVRGSDGAWTLALADLHAVKAFGGPTPARIETNLAQVRNSFVAGTAREFLWGLRAYRAAGPPPGVDGRALARRVRDRADAMLEAFHRRRAARCLKRSSAFAVDRADTRRIYRRREVPLEDVLRAMESAAAGGGAALKEGGATRVLSGFTVGGTRAVLKEYRPGGPGAFLEAAAGRGRGRRAWVGAVGLELRGVGAPRPLALVEQRVLGLPTNATVLMEDLSALPQLDVLVSGGLLDGDPRRVRSLAASLGRFLGRVHGRGVYHADLKACNIRVDPDAPGGPAFKLLDHDRLVFGLPVGSRRKVKNLMQLHTSLPRRIPRTARGRFLRAYLRAAPFPGGFKALWRAVLAAGRGRQVVYVTARGDVFEPGYE